MEKDFKQKPFDEKDKSVTQDAVVVDSVEEGKKALGNDKKKKSKRTTTPKVAVNKVDTTMNPLTVTGRAAEVVTSSENSSGLANSSLSIRTSFSGTAAIEPIDLSASTNSTRSYRSGDRPGKRMDPKTRKIDFAIAEPVKANVKRSKPLSETDAKQGFNGNYVNDHIMSQKCSGNVPADEMFNRSCDEIDLDMIYFAEGQYNVNGNSGLREYNRWVNFNPITKYSDDTDTCTAVKGNYIMKALDVVISPDGVVTDFAFDVEDITKRQISKQEIELAGDAALRSYNQLEIDRLSMVDKAGDENSSSWSPLGESIPNATSLNHIIRDLDAFAGDNVYHSLRRLQYAHAYQLNKSAKDGLRITGPMAEMCNMNVAGLGGTTSQSMAEGAEAINAALRFPSILANGGAGLWVAINESLSKFNTKGKLLSLPRSFRMAIETALANKGSLMMHSSLHAVEKEQDLFSTLNGPYDPFLPVVITDKATIVHPLNINDFFTFNATNGVQGVVRVGYENLRSRYTFTLTPHFVSGLYKFFRNNASRFLDAIKPNNPDVVGQWVYTSDRDGKMYLDDVESPYDENGNLHIHIPIVSSITGLSLWDLIVCGSTPFMVEDRVRAFNELIKYESNHGYPYTGIVPLSSISETEALNFSFHDIDTEISVQTAGFASALKVQLPEVFWPVSNFKVNNVPFDGFEGDMMAIRVVLPHYFVQNQFVVSNENDTDGYNLLLSGNASTMAYPSLRSGTTLKFIEDLMSFPEDSYRLMLDRMITYPGYSPSIERSKLAQHPVGTLIEAPTVYKYGLSTDGQPTLLYYGGAKDKDDEDKCLTIRDILETPRELGRWMVAPAGILTPCMRLRDPDEDQCPGSIPLSRLSYDAGYFALSGPSFTVKRWALDGTEIYNESRDRFGLQDFLSEYAISTTPGDSLKFDYFAIQSNPTALSLSDGTLLSINSLFPNSTDGILSTADGIGRFKPFVDGAFSNALVYDDDHGTWTETETQTALTGNKIYSFQRYFWGRIQRLPFVINPFDVNSVDILSHNYGRAAKFDIYDFAIFFGLCGFKASDFSEYTYERLKQRISLGMLYVTDTYQGV